MINALGEINEEITIECYRSIKITGSVSKSFAQHRHPIHTRRTQKIR